MKLKKTQLKVVSFATIAMTAIELNAKTVALWPIEYDPENKEYNLRCANNPDYDLTTTKNLLPSNGTNTLSWNLPPNPDGSKFLFAPYNRYSLYSTADGYLQNGNVGAMMTESKAYTLEGFVKFNDVGGYGATWVIISSVAPLADGQQDFRMVLKEGKYYLRFAVGRPKVIDTEFAGPAKTADELKDGKWHHWAYTYQPDNGSGQRVIEAFWDGVSVGTLSDAAVTATYSNNGELMLGSRGKYGNTVKGAIEYVRVSDTILKSEEFLNYGGGGTVVTDTKSPTVGYWRLGADANGKPDLSSQLGNAGFYAASMANGFSASPKVTVEQGKTSLYVIDEGAFAGQPANPSVTLDGGNNGAYYCNGDDNGGMNFDGLGTCLDFSKDWTVEMYFRPDARDTSITGSRSLFGTMQGKGWVLMTCVNAKSSANWARRFRLSVADDEGALFSHADMAPELPEWRGEWKHIALVHRATGGNSGYGTWQLYLDGVLHSTLENSRELSDVSPGRFAFGTVHNANGLPWINGASGAYDCVRVAAAALSPEQFICAKNGTEATKVQAFFPLDKSANGSASSFFKDVVGSWTVGSDPAAKYIPAATTEDAPEVSNPDSSEKLAPSSATGSVDFRTNGGAQSACFCCDKATLDAFNAEAGDRSVTIEAFVKHNAGSSGDENILVATIGSLDNTWPSMDMRLSYNADTTKGFILSDVEFTTGTFKDVKTTVTMSDGKWHHVALVATHDETTAYWRLYLDGALEYENSAALRTARGRGIKTLVLGGRYWSGGSNFNGLIANLRISKGALEASKFMNGTAPTEVAPSTIAYWPLDYRHAQLDMTSKVTDHYDLIGTVTGDRSRAYVTNYHASVEAEAVRNLGSVTMDAASRMVSRSVAADYMGLTEPFTLEGCVLPAVQIGTKSTICGTYRNNFGWKMIYDATGSTPRIKVFGCGKLPTGSFVDGAFDWDASPLTNGWHQLAVAYDPAECGTWTLFIDAAKVATLANRWNPKGQGAAQMDFTIGAIEGSGETSFAANYDVWRLSRGVRKASELLYNPEAMPGMIMLFK